MLISVNTKIRKEDGNRGTRGGAVFGFRGTIAWCERGRHVYAASNNNNMTYTSEEMLEDFLSLSIGIGTCNELWCVTFPASMWGYKSGASFWRCISRLVRLRLLGGRGKSERLEIQDTVDVVK